MKWYNWINPFFWIELYATALVCRGARGLSYKIKQELK